MKLLTKYCDIRLVLPQDAAFIVNLRKDAEGDGVVSQSALTPSAQEKWIEAYKKREAAGKELYFIAEAEGVKYGVMRLYNIGKNCFTSGSWIFRDKSPNNISVATNILVRKFGFEYLGKEINYYDVRKKNLKVIQFNNILKPEFIDEDELSNYYLLKAGAFEKKVHNFSRFCGIDFSLDISQFIQN